MSKNTNGKRLNESQRCKIVAKLSKTNAEENQEDVNEDENVTSQVTDGELGNNFVFKGFKSLYKQVFDIEDQLICSEVQAEAEETFDDLRKLFELFQSKVRALSLKAKRKKLQNLRQ
ncbi:hypothetical protein R1flu_026773 [Riccia fluitans]|uniref:Uncharacterized protein n=1 Tax=Riccia fluitans TaxID=41844 RepID=A0ABD1XHE6_9MARC